MNEEKQELNRYRVEYRREGNAYISNAVIEARTEEEAKLQVLELMKPEPVREPEEAPTAYPTIERLSDNPLAGLIFEGVKEQLTSFGKYGLRVEMPDGSVEMQKLDGFKFRDLVVNQTRDPYKFCVRMLVNKDSNMIEEQLRRTFTIVEDIGTSADMQEPEGIDKGFPTADGFHEWVCIVGMSKRLHVPPLNFAQDVYTLQHIITWGPDAEHMFEEQTGRDITEATEEELLALQAGGHAFIGLAVYELGGEDYADHRDLCEDGYKWVGLTQRVKLSPAPHDTDKISGKGKE